MEGMIATSRNVKNRNWLVFLIVLFSTIDKRLLSGVNGLVSITVLEITCYLSLFVLFLDLIIFRVVFYKRITEFLINNKMLVFYFSSIIIVSIANVFLGKGFFTISQLKDILPSFALSLLLYIYCRDQKQLVYVAISLLVGCAINSSLGFLQGVFGGPHPVPLADSVLFKMDISGHFIGADVATGWFSHPNAFAIYLLPMILFLTYACINQFQKSFLKGICIFVVLLLSFFSIYKTQGKGAMVWLAWGYINWLIINYLKISMRSKVLFLLLSLFSCAVILFSVSSYFGVSYKSLSTIYTRFQLWQTAIYVLSNNFTDLITGNVIDKMLLFSPSFTYGKFIYPNAHNAVINQAVYYGVITFALYLSVIVSVILSCFNTCEKNRYVKLLECLVVILFSMIGAYLLEPASEGVLQQAQFFLVLILIKIVSNTSDESCERN